MSCFYCDEPEPEPVGKIEEKVQCNSNICNCETVYFLGRNITRSCTFCRAAQIDLVELIIRGGFEVIQLDVASAFVRPQQEQEEKKKKLSKSKKRFMKACKIYNF